MLKEGDRAPDFSLQEDSGREVILRGLKGKKVVLYFYPKDDTPGCTREACHFRDQATKFQQRNTKYGAWGEKNMYGKKSMGLIRSTFVIDEKGKIEKIYRKVRVDGHVDAVLEGL